MTTILLGTDLSSHRGYPPRRRGRSKLTLASHLLHGWARAPLLYVHLLLLTACATTGSTLGSGVGDRTVFAPPYYAGAGSLPVPARVAHIAVSYQRGAVQSEMFEPGAEGAVSTLLTSMNASLDALRGTGPIELRATAGAVPPDVRFGCDSRQGFECDVEEQRSAGHRTPGMLLSVGRPSEEWADAVGAALQADPRDHVLVVTLEIGEYWPHQKDGRGGKEVRLGTGYSQKVPWLTSLDQPVQVLQLTGALVDESGRAVRIGAEGLLAKRTNILMSGFGFQALITPEDVSTLAALRRDDLAGAPLVWEVALSNLVRQLTGEGVMR